VAEADEVQHFHLAAAAPGDAADGRVG
jgi:hypothetical protein